MMVKIGTGEVIFMHALRAAGFKEFVLDDEGYLHKCWLETRMFLSNVRVTYFPRNLSEGTGPNMQVDIMDDDNRGVVLSWTFRNVIPLAKLTKIELMDYVEKRVSSRIIADYIRVVKAQGDGA